MEHAAPARTAVRRPTAAPSAVAVAVALALALAYGDLIPWVVAGWRTGDGPLQGLMALALAVVLARDGLPRQLLARLDRPRLSPVPLALAVGAPIVGALAHRALPLEVVRAAAAVVAVCGLAGLYLPRDRWRDLLPLAILAGLLLPITAHLDVLLGWPLRKWTASVAASTLAAVGPAIATETVLRVEGGVAHVDLPCAGVRGLWSGLTLLLAATAILRRPLDLAWCAVAACAFGVFVAANAARVTLLVGLVHLADLPLLADVLHQPLGVLGFVLAAGLGVTGLWLRPERPLDPIADDSPAAHPWLPLLPAAGLVVACLAGAPTAAVAPAAPPVPAGAVALEASEAERAFVAAHGAAISKARIDGGTVALVASRGWEAHHVPQMCLEAAGFTVEADHPAHVDGQPLRVARAVRDGRPATALWWLQAADTVTDDHVVRIRDGLVSDRTWVLVSVLLEGPVDTTDPAVATLVRELRASVARALEDS